jgi:hypothetical protein
MARKHKPEGNAPKILATDRAFYVIDENGYTFRRLTFKASRNATARTAAKNQRRFLYAQSRNLVPYCVSPTEFRARVEAAQKAQSA